MAKMSFIIYFLKRVQYLLLGHHAQQLNLMRLGLIKLNEIRINKPNKIRISKT